MLECENLKDENDYVDEFDASDLQNIWIGPIDCAAAITRNLDDKAQIDQFITASVGFESINCVVRAAVFQTIFDAGDLLIEEWEGPIPPCKSKRGGGGALFNPANFGSS